MCGHYLQVHVGFVLSTPHMGYYECGVAQLVPRVCYTRAVSSLVNKPLIHQYKDP